jgi:hypothetical protein
MFYSDSQQLITLAFNVKETFLSSPLLHRQKEDEVERQHLGSILVRNHHVVSGHELISYYLRITLPPFLFRTIGNVSFS